MASVMLCFVADTSYSKCLNKWIGSAPRDTVLQLSTHYTNPFPSNSHLLNPSCWCRLSNALEHAVNKQTTKFHFRNSPCQHVARLFQTTLFYQLILSDSCACCLQLCLSVTIVNGSNFLIWNNLNVTPLPVFISNFFLLKCTVFYPVIQQLCRWWRLGLWTSNHL